MTLLFFARLGLPVYGALHKGTAYYRPGSARPTGCASLSGAQPGRAGFDCLAPGGLCQAAPSMSTDPVKRCTHDRLVVSRAGWSRCHADFFGVSALVGFVLAYLSPAVKDGWSFGSFDTGLRFTSLSFGAFPHMPHNLLDGDG